MKLKTTHSFTILLSLFIFFLLIPYTALAQTPAVTTQAVTGITAVTATGNGDITDLGVPNPTPHAVSSSTGHNPTTGDNTSTHGAADATGPITSHITGLTPGTT